MILSIVAVLAIAGALAIREYPVLRDARAARRAVSEGRYRQAEPLIASWLRARPDAGEAHLLKARVAAAAGRLREVGAGLKRAEVLGYSRDEIQVVRAILDAHYGRLRQAAPILRRAFEEGRARDPQLCETLIRVCLETQDLRLAASVIEYWARVAPEDPGPFLWRTELDRIDEEGGPKLIEDYRAALRLAPDLAQARLGLAEALSKAGLIEEAEKEVAIFIRLHPEDPAGFRLAGRIALARGELGLSARRLDRAIALDPGDATAMFDRAQIDLRNRDLGAALARLDRAVEADPSHLAARHARSRVLSRLGRKAEAEAEHKAADALRDDQVRLHSIQARLALAPHDLGQQALLAKWLLDHGKEREAVDRIRRILAADPQHREANRLLADFHDRQGEADRARYYRSLAR
jgi:tetratricopeptide (TPR) repeat protein